ncbi:MAG: DUF2922 domain-containing protein [Anaerococcus sp.]|nr:DUF2922 domain-containing protein [Anaerococcus sp.]
MEKTRIKLQFKDAKGSSRIISVDNPKPDLTDENINQAMDDLLNTGVLLTKNGPLNEKLKAYKEIISQQPYTLS